MRASLSTKLIVASAGAMLASALVLSGITSYALSNAFGDIEDNQMREEALRFVHAFNENLEARRKITNDWCNWDEFYEAVRGGGVQPFFDANVNDIAADNFDANLFVLLGPGGRRMQSYYYDFDAAAAGPPPDALAGLEFPAGGECRAGLLPAGDDYVVFTTCPILTSDGQGPAVGTLATARRLDAALVARLARAMNASLTVHRFGDAAMPADFAAAKTALAAGAEVWAAPISETLAGGYALIRDGAGNPAAIARVDRPRVIHRIGVRSMRTYLAVLALVALPTVIALALALNAMIIRPLARLTAHVIRIGRQGELARYPDAAGADEIGVLGRAFNGMIDNLNTAQEQVQAQASAIAESELRYRVLVELAPMAIVVLVDGRIRYANSAFLRITGVEDGDALIGTAFAAFLHPAVRDDTMARIGDLVLQGGRVPAFDVRLERRGGRIVEIEITGACVLFEGDIGAQLALQDVTERRRLENELRLLSQRDGLTGLANRRAFDEMLDRECRRATRCHAPLAVAMLDLDAFKEYNDHYGHQAGDSILRTAAETLGAAARRPIDFVARYGGEEFVAILPDTGPEGAVCLGDRMRAAVAALRIPHAYSPTGDCLTISVGIAVSTPGERVAPATMLQRADRALYAAKKSGRNRVVLDGAGADAAPDAAGRPG